MMLSSQADDKICCLKYYRVVLSFDPTARILEQDDQAREVVSSNEPFSMRSRLKGLYSRLCGPGAR